MKFKLKCDWCGREIERYEKQIKKHNFCCRKCLADFSNKKKNPDGYLKLKNYEPMANTLRRMNPKTNKTRMTPEVRDKIRMARLNTGKGKSYRKIYGVHEHRIVAEEKIGRPLKKGEVVHHIDGDIRNNNPDNLIVLASQVEHAALHRRLNKLSGGDAK